ncbi:MAG TPA: helix-turn-helix domain-containing protein [Burkholderiales bacterium]|nr:helix-turn-helix domain-containing protein [Burkholderiales bacterium]
MNSNTVHEPAFEDRPAEAVGEQEHVGEILARARAAQGLTLDDVAQQLKFGARQIDALEQGRFESLPGSTFARGMVRSYARLLKLDAEALLGQVEGKFEVPDADRLATRYREPVPFSDGSRRTNITYALLSVAILLVVAGVLYGWQQERVGANRLTFVPAARAPLEPPRTTPATPPRPAATAPNVVALAGDRTSPSPSPSPSTSTSPSPSTSPSASPGASESTAASASSSSPAPIALATGRIVLHFDAESWVEIRDGTGKLLLSQLNPAGSEKVVQGSPPFSVVIGNAQNVRVTYDGEAFDLTPHIRVEVARFTLK